ncbi:hypothetical protein RGR602_PC00954 (plasmid) [Rhizobium gallicum bv. gallicum R602sp]|uniref:Uncharacterized protein n=1 Tax=Rhizobium gallicum bv. gallicum R602sp TaxID=1041138 RepID=A0A0B4XEV0_9HYPH|nr:hypothetical protein RGR602_PC00954 [Rhizobium gallicum bv. gallicum R602sp]
MHDTVTTGLHWLRIHPTHATLRDPKEYLLKRPTDNGFTERRNAAAEAKRELLAKFASAPKSADPAMQERLAARDAVTQARELRRAEREALKAAQEKAEAESRQAEIADQVSRAAAAEAARKAERDRRYAARKARKS